MDRSGRRTAVIAWAMTACVVFGGAATSTAAPAYADGRGSDSAGTEDAAPPHRTRTPSRTEARTSSAVPGVRGPGLPTPAPAPVDPCPWWPPAPIPPPPRNTQGGIVVGVPGLPVVSTVPVFGDRRIVIDGPDADESNSLLPETPIDSPAGVWAESPPALEPTVPAVPGAAAPVAPVVQTPSSPPSFRPPIAAPPPRQAVPPPATLPASGPSAPQLPQGYLPELRPDDLGRLVASALPGLAALVGMTLFGGVVGYRQARAGYLLRAAGAGRFLQ